MDRLLELSEAFPLIDAAPGEQLLAEGSTSGRLYILVEGRVELRKGSVRLATFDRPGTPLGESDRWSEHPSNVRATGTLAG